MTHRIERLQRELAPQNASAFLVTKLSNIRWLCGFSGTAGTLLVTPQRAVFLTDFRYRTQADAEVKDAETVIYRASVWCTLEEDSALQPGERILVEAAALTIEQQEQLHKSLPNAELIPTSLIVEKMMAVKEAGEIELHRKAAAITDKVFRNVLPLLKPGVRERDIAAEITYLHKSFGADCDSFEPIVASGWRSALPHGRASDKRIRKNELVTLDLGCSYKGYASDLTRTVTVGKAEPKARELYRLVLQAQTAAIKAAKPGMTNLELDGIARDIITDAGYGAQFGHGLGHGLGLETHAWPKIGPTAEAMTLQENMVFTIEPGIYLEGYGGVRIEDDVVLTAEGAQPLNKATKKLLEL